ELEHELDLAIGGDRPRQALGPHVIVEAPDRADQVAQAGRRQPMIEIARRHGRTISHHKDAVHFRRLWPVGLAAPEQMITERLRVTSAAIQWTRSASVPKRTCACRSASSEMSRTASDERPAARR